MTPLAAYLAAVRELVEELNGSAASGLINRRALVLLGTVDRLTRALERESARAQATEGQ